MTDLLKRLKEARQQAILGSLPMRRKDAALYQLLANCLSICEEVEREGLHAELKDAIRVTVDIRGKMNLGRGRRYAEANSDTYVLVSRYVLEGNDNRNSIYRYAASLREAGKRQIASIALEVWLKKNGGISALFLSRPVVKRIPTTKVLHLNSAIKAPKDVPFTVTLNYDGKGRYDVIE